MSAESAPPFRSILLVEDEPGLTSAIRIAIKKMGMDCMAVSTLESAKKAFQKIRPDLILLDRNLPDGEGLGWCASLREARYDGMILILTAKGQVEDRVKGLNIGADDYLPKPFSWSEFEARIQALARRARTPSRHAPSGESILWQLEEAERKVLGPKGWVTLTSLEFKLVKFLMESAGRTIPRDELLKKVWGFSFLPQTRTVDHFMGRLRKWFESDPENPRFLITVRGSGYRFDPEGKL